MTVNAAHLVLWLSMSSLLCLGRLLWPFHGCRSFCSLCALSYQGWTIAWKDAWYHNNCFWQFLIWHVSKIQDTELLHDTYCCSEEFVHVSVTWCRRVLMDGTFTAPCGCQSHNLALDTSYFSDVTSVCTGFNSIRVCGVCVVACVVSYCSSFMSMYVCICSPFRSRFQS